MRNNKLSPYEIIELDVKLRRRNEESLKEVCAKEGWKMSETGGIFDTPKQLNTHSGGEKE